MLQKLSSLHEANGSGILEAVAVSVLADKNGDASFDTKRLFLQETLRRGLDLFQVRIFSTKVGEDRLVIPRGFIERYLVEEAVGMGVPERLGCYRYLFDNHVEDRFGEKKEKTGCCSGSKCSSGGCGTTNSKSSDASTATSAKKTGRIGCLEKQ